MYFAKIDSNNIVTQVIVADQSFINTQSGTWVQTDILGVSPKNYAGVGHTWRADLNGFVPTNPFPSWTLNTSTCKYEAPTPRPTSGGPYQWNEASTSWVAIAPPRS